MDKDFRNIYDSQTDTYVLRILGTGGDVITSRIIAVAMAGRLWEHPSVIRTWAARSVATTIAGYGLYAFYRRQIGDYLIMRMHFVFYDYEKGIFPFLLDYLAVMILIAFIGYYSGVFLKKTGKRKRKGSY